MARGWLSLDDFNSQISTVLPYLRTVRVVERLVLPYEAQHVRGYRDSLMCFASSIPRSRSSTELVADTLYEVGEQK